MHLDALLAHEPLAGDWSRDSAPNHLRMDVNKLSNSGPGPCAGKTRRS
jgi:hypothetical protein